MRFLLTSDWHLGRLFHGVHLTEDQAHILDQLIDLAGDVKPDAILLAGDVYDRAVPPPQAIELLDDVLSRLTLGLKIPVVMIAGNHDSPVRLGFGSNLLAQSGLYVNGMMNGTETPIFLEDEHGPIAVYAMPYAEPPVVREKLDEPAAVDHNTAMAARISALPKPDKKRSIIVAHAFTAGGSESESERPLSVGGIGTVEAKLFNDFNFAAVGHLHRPQDMSDGRIHYPGSLMKYSFSEAHDQKSVSLVEMDSTGRTTIERITLTPKRDLRKIEGFFNDLINSPDPEQSRDDYLLVSLLDTGAILDAMGRLRDVYPNALHLERPFLTSRTSDGNQRIDHRSRSESDLFEAFFEQVTGEGMTAEQKKSFGEIIESWRKSERES